MSLLDPVAVPCPYCGETLTLDVDASPGAQSYVEDCHVCCQPIVVDVVPVPGAPPHVEVRRENE